MHILGRLLIARELGFGEQAARREAQSRITQTRTKQIALMDQIAREIVESHAQAQSRWLQIQSAQEAVSAARDSFNRDWDRIENGQGIANRSLAIHSGFDERSTRIHPRRCRLQLGTVHAASIPWLAN